ncbi:MAG: SurA N-terminal domain-containing protein [Verrucomicrobiota bacterium]|nr:SurA N-terminal domain-containing protein [Verrucomicrobiota bacterium]
MMISNFNKLIQSKIVWGLFIGLVVFAFVAMDMATPDNNSPKKNNTVVGKVFNDEVKYSELMQSFYSTSLDYTLRSGQELRMTDQVEQELTNAAWERIAVLKKANNQEYSVSDNEIVERIKDIIRYVSQSDQYNPEIYEAFVNNFLPRYGMNAKGFDLFIKETLMIEKILEDIDENLLFIDEAEIKETFHNLNDLLSVQYALIERKGFKSSPISEEENYSFYKKNIEEFRVPEKISVDYIKFQIIDYTNSITVTPNMIETSYSNNLDRFKLDSENEEISYKSLEDVSEEIKIQLLMLLARDAATAKAYDFVADISDSGKNFSDVAKDLGIPISTSKSFSINDQVEQNETSQRFNEIAFNLDLTPENYFSDPIVEANNVYVLALKEKFDSYLPDYEDISQQVNNAAQFEADNNEYADFTHSLFLEIKSKISDGISFNEAISSHKLDVVNCNIFSLSKPLEGNFSREIMSQMYNAQEGFVTAINSAEGVIISYLLKREMDENSKLDEQRQEITAQLRQQKTLELFRNRKQNIINEAVIEIF